MSRRWLVVLAAVGLLGQGMDCKPVAGGSSFGFTEPLPGQLSVTGEVAFALRVPIGLREKGLEILLDGNPVPASEYAPTPDGVAGSVDVPDAGEHTLVAVLQAPNPGFAPGGPDWTFDVAFETADLQSPPECEVLNDAECLLPYPSSRFQEDVGDATETGLSLSLPQAGMPSANGPDPDASLFDGLDGYSPTVQVLMHFPQGVDLVASGASILKAAGCCGQVDATPYVDVRTHDDTSVQSGSPTVLIDAETGERILHWVENDAHATEQSRRVTFLRPGIALRPGRRYVVAVRDLVDPTSAPVVAEPAFRVLRDALPTTIDAIEARRGHFEDAVFPVLEAAGVDRDDLILAFDFTTRSDTQLTELMLALRDDALAAAAQIEAAGLGAVDLARDAQFNLDHVNPNCQSEGDPVWRQLKGRLVGPYYMDGAIDTPDGTTSPLGGTPRLNLDADGNPIRGVRKFNFDIVVPCSALDGTLVRPILIGHGLFGDGSGTLEGFASQADAFGAAAGSFDYILGATDFRGLSSLDLFWLANSVIGVSGTSQLNNFPAFVDRLKQGMVNTLVLAHLMKSGFFNVIPELQVPVGSGPENGVFPGPDEDLYYVGNSLGGIMGLFLAALTPDIERFNIDIGSFNFSLLLQRSTQFDPFDSLLDSIGVSDPLDKALGLGLLHELWVTSESAGYARHVTSDPLPGSIPKKILMTVAWLDKQVANHGSEITARTLGLPNLQGSVVADLTDIPDVPAGPDGLESAYVVYDAGSFDVFDPAFDAVIPPLTNEIPDPVCDPHGDTFVIPASLTQLVDFLQPGGAIFNNCTDDGVCNASEAFETPGGVAPADVCDPLS